MSYDPQFQQRIFEMLQSSQYWDAKQMRDFQDQQLSQLLAFSRDRVPFYRDRLANALTAQGRVNWDRWHDIPVLTRDDLHKHREAMLAPNLPPGHGFVEDHMGSGTTGKPVTTRHNSLMHLVSHAALFRAFDWHHLNYGKVFCHIEGDDPNFAQWPEGENNGPWGPSWDLESAKGTAWQINRNASPEQLSEFLGRKTVSYLSGRPNRILSVARATAKLVNPPQLSAILTLSESPTQEIRGECRDVFGADIISLYASKEVYNIAHQCSSGSHYHVNTELLYFEVLDDTDHPCAFGERGRAVITSFFNTSQPFIRYDIGDQVVMGDKCNCGRNLPVIEKIIGRTNHLFRFPGGRVVGLTLPPKSMNLIAARSWQIAQVGDLEIEVRYILDSSDVKLDFESIANLVRSRTDPNVNVSFKQIKTLPLTPSGKFIEYVCELPAEGA
jgi:phenylacetate-CoA ligase